MLCHSGEHNNAFSRIEYLRKGGHLGMQIFHEAGRVDQHEKPSRPVAYRHHPHHGTRDPLDLFDAAVGTTS